MSRDLDWEKFIELASERAKTKPARALVRAYADPLNFAKSPAIATQLQAETQEVSFMLSKDPLWSCLIDLEEYDQVLEALGRGSVIGLEGLVILKGWLIASETWEQTPREEIRGERLKKAIASLSSLSGPLQWISKVLAPDGTMAENASSRLQSLHHELRSTRKNIQEELGQIISSLQHKGVLQGDYTDLRDGRYVLPVKSSHQSEVSGILFDASVTKQTVFVEPQAISPLNNRLRQVQNQIVEEMEIILRTLSEKLKPFCEEFQSTFATLAYWDHVHAKSEMGTQYGGKSIELMIEDPAFVLHDVAHPLLFWSLPREKVVRNHIEFGGATRALVITGPNTGGKTVLLKTLGMAAQCARSGFPFPASRTPRVPFFDQIFSDLGDAQSIEQSVSSFSGHVQKFKSILESISGSGASLVLLDELNTATDPEEGAALARAILETLIRRGAMVVATTHDPRLKILAMNDKSRQIECASMAFDETSRTPQYQLQIGIPGRSRAIETAERLGLDSEVLTRARELLSSEHNQLESMLSQLEANVAETRRSKTEALTLEKSLKERTQETFGDLLDQTKRKLKRMLETAQDEVREKVRKLEESRSRRDIDQVRSDLSGEFTKNLAEIKEIEELVDLPASSESPGTEGVGAQTVGPKWTIGQNVLIPKYKSKGVIQDIIEQPGKGVQFKIQMGAMALKLTEDDIEATSGPAQKPKSKVTVEAASVSPPPQGASLDLRGKRLDVAMRELEQYLDQAFLSRAFSRVTIVHGLGTGAIRENTRKLLASLPYVKDFHDGGAGAGGTGATIVEF